MSSLSISETISSHCQSTCLQSPPTQLPTSLTLKEEQDTFTKTHTPSIEVSVTPLLVGQQPAPSLPAIYTNAASNTGNNSASGLANSGLTRQADGTFRIQGNNLLEIMIIPGIGNQYGFSVPAGENQPAGIAVFYHPGGQPRGGEIRTEEIFVVTNQATGQGYWRALSTIPIADREIIKSLAIIARDLGLTPSPLAPNLLQPLQGAGSSYVTSRSAYGSIICCGGQQGGTHHPRIVFTYDPGLGRVIRNVELTTGGSPITNHSTVTVNPKGRLHRIRISGANGAPSIPNVTPGRLYFQSADGTIRTYNSTTNSWEHPIVIPAFTRGFISGQYADGTLRLQSSGGWTGDSVMIHEGQIFGLNTAGTHYYLGTIQPNGQMTYGYVPLPQDSSHIFNIYATQIRNSRAARAWIPPTS